MTPSVDLTNEFKKVESEVQSYWGAPTKETPDTCFEDYVKNLLTNYDPKVRQRFYEELFLYGPICPLLNDEQVTEILINGPQDIFFEKSGAFQQLKDSFFSQISYQNFIDQICKESGMVYDYNIPHADGKFGSFRTHLVTNPLTEGVTHLSLRRHKKTPWTLNDLLKSGWGNEEQVRLLKKLVFEKKNLLIVGPTGSGKTSLLGACLTELQENERVIAIEDTNELSLPNKISLKLLTRVDLNGELKDYHSSDLIKQALRMRPQRLVMGEVRGGEAKDLLLALSTGHKGSLSTLHACDAREALFRLELLVQMGAPNWSQNVIRQLIQLSLDYVVTLEQANGKRYLKKVHQLGSLEENGMTLEQIY